MHFSSLSQRLSESATIAMAQKARELKNAGKDVIALSLGEPDFDTPEHIKKAAKNALHQGHTKYTPIAGVLELREAICNKLLRENNLSYQSDQILVSSGAKQSINQLILTLVDQGDEVIIPTPYWVSYIEMVRMAGGTPIVIETEAKNDFVPSITQFADKIGPNTKAILFSTPANPTGTVYPKTLLEDLSDLLEQYPVCHVISDEIYEHILYEGKHLSIASVGNLFQKTITVNGMSKGFAMTGWRIGYMAGPTEIIGACTKLQGQVTSGANSIAQYASIAALNQSLDATVQMKNAFRKRRDFVVEKMNQWDGIHINPPKGAFYVFPDISYYLNTHFENRKINNSSDLAMYLLEEALVATVAGTPFGYPNGLRISYAAGMEDLEKAMHRIEKALQQLKK